MIVTVGMINMYLFTSGDYNNEETSDGKTYTCSATNPVFGETGVRNLNLL